MLIVTDEMSGVTESSLNAWRTHRRRLGSFVEARIYAGPDGAAVEGRVLPGPAMVDTSATGPTMVVLITAPTMVLIDDEGNEMWLCGTCCGYGGEAPRGAEKILDEEGFGAEAAEKVIDTRYAKVVVQKQPDSTVSCETTQKDATPWAGKYERITRWLWRQREGEGLGSRQDEAARLAWDDPYLGNS